MNLTVTSKVIAALQGQKNQLHAAQRTRDAQGIRKAKEEIEVGVRNAFGGFACELSFYGETIHSPKERAPELLVQVEPQNAAVMARIIAPEETGGILFVADRELCVVANGTGVAINERPFEMKMPTTDLVGVFGSFGPSQKQLAMRITHLIEADGAQSQETASTACVRLLLGELAGAAFVMDSTHATIPFILEAAGFKITDQDGKGFSEHASPLLVAAHRMAHDGIISKLKMENCIA